MATNEGHDTAPLFAMIGAVSPVLVPYTQERIVGELWHRPGLAPRDRALVTLAILVSRNAALAYPHYVNKALDSGLTGAEVSELLTHLAFYAGWPSAFGAMPVVREIFAQRGIPAAQLPEVSPALLPPPAPAESAARAAFLAETLAPVSPALAHFTGDLLEGEVWRRPGLTPRDRALATLAALATLGQAEFFPSYLGRALRLGVTAEEFGEALAHVAFYGGWGLAIRATLAAKPILAAQPA
ncbi:carboxymuconolactone decarboxylase family protein [Roseomonas sp. GC11]|uniref:carboxymuconolactone decarboxylase family protein n=1 Tax=Roseomonas sp. GC11 TaxID=2950546 RepID=UPI00210CDF8A|nr:carboxymuconolactone decarboxylase family protein [Roseomonas sp. GC11]MCQ4160325.1 carboxymuconolactone decarboxylase family protein [Roseomonas sp. GC11]